MASPSHRPSRLTLIACSTVAVTFGLGGGARAQEDLGVEAQLAAGQESAELAALREFELAAFGRQQALLRSEYRGPEGLSPALSSEAPDAPDETAVGGRDLSFLQGLALPDLPIRWDERVVRYLEYFRNTRRGQSLMAAWLRRSTRYGEMIRDRLEAHELPRDLRCVAMAESGFDPTVRSDAGAAGMWQFVTRTGEGYGLTGDHWVDQRLDPMRSTDAAARYLGDLYRRLGTWELALAAYNMGYGALLRAIRKYNSNDYWVLSRLEAGLPFETTVYVAKIMACAVVMRNPDRFGLGELVRDPPLRVGTVAVPGGIPLSQLARPAGMEADELASLNPELLRRRTPPGVTGYELRLPVDRVESFSVAWTRQRPRHPANQAHVVRFGESLEDVAYRYRTTERALRGLNELADGERPRAGMTLLVPAVEPRPLAAPGEPPVATVPDRELSYPDRRRVFYRVMEGDQLPEIAAFFGVTVDELRTWNNLEAAALLPQGLLVQLFVPAGTDLSRAVVLATEDVRVLVVGSEEFFDYHERQRGRVRFRYTVRPGDTLGAIGDRFGLSTGSLARINRFARNTTLHVGQEIVVYADPDRVPAALRREVPTTAPPSPAASDDEDVAPTAAGGNEDEADLGDGDEADAPAAEATTDAAPAPSPEAAPAT